MKHIIIPICIILGWILLFLSVFYGGTYILNSSKRFDQKKWGRTYRDYDYEMWKFKFYVIAFFVGIPILFIISLF